MPKSRNRRTSRRAIRRRPRQSGGLSVLRLNSQTQVVPQVYDTRVVYTATYSSTLGSFPVSLNTNAFLFTGNNLYNPDLNVILESYPVGHVQIGTLYNRYQVIGSSIEVMVNANLASSFRYMISAHAYSSNLPTGATAVEDFTGLPLATKVHCLGPNTGTTVGRISKAYRTSFVLSRPEQQCFNNEDLSGYCTNAAFQPASQWFWYFVISNNAIGAIIAPSATLTFRIVYHVRYYQPHMLTSHFHSTTGVDPPDNDKDFDPCDCAAMPLVAEGDEMKDEDSITC
jgi:hypothetical protein